MQTHLIRQTPGLTQVMCGTLKTRKEEKCAYQSVKVSLTKNIIDSQAIFSTWWENKDTSGLAQTKTDGSPTQHSRRAREKAVHEEKKEVSASRAQGRNQLVRRLDEQGRAREEPTVSQWQGS